MKKIGFEAEVQFIRSSEMFASLYFPDANIAVEVQWRWRKS